MGGGSAGVTTLRRRGPSPCGVDQRWPAQAARLDGVACNGELLKVEQRAWRALDVAAKTMDAMQQQEV